MNAFCSYKINLILLGMLLLFPGKSGFAQKNDFTPASKDHILTLYVIPPSKPLEWDTPKNLYKSAMASYVSTIFKKDKAFMGHVFVKLSSPLLDEPFYGGMTRKKPKEQRQYVLKDRIGFSVLGMPVEGWMETKEELLDYIDYYQKKDKLSFISYKINEAAAQKIIDFIGYFTTRFDDEHAPCDFYGGAFWPGYFYEGSGCTAFGLTLLEIAEIEGNEMQKWLRSFTIPGELIGGIYNDGKKIRRQTILNSKSWADNRDSTGFFIDFSIYDPQLIYEWITNKRESITSQSAGKYLPAEQDKISGLFSDRSLVEVSAKRPILHARPDSNIFITNYYENLHLENPDRKPAGFTPQHVSR